MRRSLLVLTVAAATLLPATAARAAEGDIIVQREPGLDRKDQRELRADAGVKLVSDLGIERTELVEPKDGDVAEALAELRANDDVVYAEPDRTMHATALLNDDYWAFLWGLPSIDAPEAWEDTSGTGVTVAVVDTGITADHEDLAGQVAVNADEVVGNGLDDDNNGFKDDVTGWDFISNDPTPQDGHVYQDGSWAGHGTHVAGTIAAVGDNNTGVVGVAPAAKILPLRALGNNGSGSTSGIAAAFDYAGDMGVKVVNASLGGGFSNAIKSTIAAHPNTLYVVAAGNDGENADVYSDAYPCALPLDNIVCVGATDGNDVRASFSNYGLTSVDLFAPGVSIFSTANGSTSAYRYMSGTSMASPHVAGAAALELAARPSATAWELKQALLISVDAKPQLTGLSVTGGRLNADRAVVAVNGPLPSPTPEPTPTATATPEPPVATPTPAPPAPPVVPVVTPTPTVTPVTYLFDVTVGGSLLTKRSKLQVRFSLSKPATVRFSIARRGTKKAPSSWTTKGRSGANRVTITRRLPTGRTLKPGSYTLSVGLSATATSSRSIRVR